MSSPTSISKPVMTSLAGKAARRPIGMFASNRMRSKLPSIRDRPPRNFQRRPLGDLGRNLMRAIFACMDQDIIDRQAGGLSPSPPSTRLLFLLNVPASHIGEMRPDSMTPLVPHMTDALQIRPSDPKPAAAFVGVQLPSTNLKPRTIVLGTAGLDGLSSSPCAVTSTFACG